MVVISQAIALAVSPKALGKLLSGEHGLNTVVDVQSQGSRACARWSWTTRSTR
jgi:hypothetical protein